MNRLLLALLIAATIFLWGMDGCSPTIEMVCEKKLPEFNANLLMSFDTLAAQFPTAFSDREVASERNREVDPFFNIPIDAPQPVVTHDDRNYWSIWGRERLEEVQGFIEVANRYPSLFKANHELNQLANEIVQFHGYADRGSAKGMANTMKDIRFYGKSLSRSLCSGNLQKPKGEASKSL